MNNRVRNKRNLQNILSYISAQKKYIDTVILPYMQPNGPLMRGRREEKELKEEVSRNALSLRSKYLTDISYFARKYGVNIVFSCIIESAGSRRYLSTLFIPREKDEKVERYRKIVLSDLEERLGISRGKFLKSFNVHATSFSIMIDHELYYPELARINLIRSDFLVAAFPQNEPVKKYMYILRSISQINSSYTLIPGSRVYVESEGRHGSYSLSYAMPTLIFNREGEIMLRYNENEQAIVIIPWKILKRERNIDRELIYQLYSLSAKYLKARR